MVLIILNSTSRFISMGFGVEKEVLQKKRTGAPLTPWSWATSQNGGVEVFG
jgi:hypothetical protein